MGDGGRFGMEDLGDWGICDDVSVGSPALLVPGPCSVPTKSQP